MGRYQILLVSVPVPPKLANALCVSADSIVLRNLLFSGERMGQVDNVAFYII